MASQPRAHTLILGALVVLVALGLSRLPGGDGPQPLRTAAFGRGSTVVLVHGLGSRPEHWLPTARLLARSHRVVMVELPGHGDEALGDFSLERATQALDEALHEQSREPVTLVGHSIGGLIAANEALEHPERVSRLVLVETALHSQIVGADREQLLRAMSTNYRGLLHAAYLSFGRDSVQGEALYREVAALDSATITRWIRLALTADLSERVAALQVPTLAILAERSWPHGEPWQVTRDALGYTRAPGIQGARIDGCGHFVMLDRPAELAEVIERFITHDHEPPPQPPLLAAAALPIVASSAPGPPASR